MRRVIGLSLTVAMGLASVVSGPAAAADIGDTAGNLTLVGPNTIVGTVTGNVTNTNGELTIKGKVIGNILQLGSGGVLVDFEPYPDKVCWPDIRVIGNIVERGDGVIYVLDCSTVDGSLKEYDGDGIAVSRGAVVTGNVTENGSGDARVANVGTVEGNLEERNSGDAQVLAGSVVDGKLSEKDSGCIAIDATSSVGGRVTGGPACP